MPRLGSAGAVTTLYYSPDLKVNNFAYILLNNQRDAA
jgi:hypothetical protein